jgi:hypothetical protein
MFNIIKVDLQLISYQYDYQCNLPPVSLINHNSVPFIVVIVYKDVCVSLPLVKT